jgi:hypothetical protein
MYLARRWGAYRRSLLLIFAKLAYIPRPCTHEPGIGRYCAVIWNRLSTHNYYTPSYAKGLSLSALAFYVNHKD